jgi:hypothetical protein
MGSFCVLFRPADGSMSYQKLSGFYDSIELAILAAPDLKRLRAEPIAIRGSDGTVVENEKLHRLLATVGREVETRRAHLPAKKTGSGFSEAFQRARKTALIQSSA